tara:strand:- start:167 stop:466 length:300 start_codon:yes stop_codon:yes gene_type:complete
MDDFLANKIIEDLMLGTMTVEEAWRNLDEAHEMISDEKHDEITALITEQLIEAEVIEDSEDLELEEIFKDESELDFKWDEPYFNDSSWDLDPGSFDFED